MLFSDGVSSVTFDAHLGKFLALSTPPFANTIQARVAAHPWGPWSPAVEIIDCYPNTDSQVYCYHAHRHAELESADGNTVVLTYDTNTATFDELSEPIYSEVYWPRLVQVTFER